MIWLVRADGTGLHELSPGAPAGGKSSPDISPDGTTVAFNTWAHPRIWTVPVEGGAPTLISDDCSGNESDCIEGEPSYSADGKSIAFVRQAVHEGVTETQIGVRDLATGDVAMLEATSTDLSVGYVTQPSFAPDGTAIVYYRVDKTPAQEHPSNTQLEVVRIADSEVTPLPQPAGAWAADPDWSPDGTTIVFSTAPNREMEGWGEGAPAAGIYTIHPDGSHLTQVCDTCLGGGWAPSFTSDGRIMFWGYQSWALMNADGSGAAHINQPRLTWFGMELGYGYEGKLQPTP